MLSRAVAKRVLTGRPWTFGRRPLASLAQEDDNEEEPLAIERIVDGLSVRFGTGSVANLTRSSVIGTAGQSLVLATVSTEPASDNESLFTVSYQERHHAVGKIPTHNRARKDASRPSDEEVLAGRAMDRALRPLVVNSSSDSIHVACSIQAHQGRGHPAALALNAASVALGTSLLTERVAAIHLCLQRDGTLIMDPSSKDVQESAAELLYAGTRDKVVMMEASSPTGAIPELLLANLMKLAHGALQPILDTQEELMAEDEEEPSDEELRATLGLRPSSTVDDVTTSTTGSALHGLDFYDEAYSFCQERFGDAALKLWGHVDNMEIVVPAETTYERARVHPSNKPLLSKSVRGRREHMLQTEIRRALLQDFLPSNFTNTQYQQVADTMVPTLASAFHKKLVQAALYQTASKYKTRGDLRGASGGFGGCETIRTIGVTIPALPDVVHGSSLFTRGETQVLCTATLGSPGDGVPHSNPFLLQENQKREKQKGAYDHLPVGSLRYTRSQEAMVSDFNSKKIKAEKEMTGDSGTFDEVQRFFLQYDFPSYSKGALPSRKGNRREVGHGKLAEKALMSAIPSAEEFPYTARVTAEVTSSNGSSSMASVCGATLALLDAGVPLAAPVAGVSVGLALGESTSESCLLLDITGTEDHYGAMDFKVAGTENGVTALQLDVKEPLPMEILVEALDLAKHGRVAILEEMESLAKQSSADIVSKLLPRPALKDSVPRVEVVRFDPLRKRDLIGPGGAVLRQLEERFGVSLDLSQEGQCLIFGQDKEMVSKAKSAVVDLVADVEEGQVYDGTVIEIKDFGAIVELLRNKEGLLHVSEITEDMSHPEGNFGIVHEHLKVGQQIEVLVTAVDPVEGSIRLSRIALLQQRKAELDKRL